MGRDSMGRFKGEGGRTLYKKVQYGGHLMQEHQRCFCIALDISKIPKGFVVHHLNGKKMDNDINNLCLMTITAHNRIHSHVAWNKGLTTKESEKWNKTIQKAVATRKGNYLAIKGKEVYTLKREGKSTREIAKALGITRATVAHRLKMYLEHQKIIDPTQAKKIDKFRRIQDLRYSQSLSWVEVGKIMGEKPDLIRRFYRRFLNITFKNV